ncbi:MAG: RagB/SusD family nutrient uptake outer membrane protein [Gelidibacter sp.]|uniref:RagB/SusD family nutrient uptake outer membrane protein n=1 Tax=Gelidibacter sp. TaxID=2018083 RepID=UPI003264365B
MKKIINKIVFTLLIAIPVLMGSCTTEDLNPTLEQNKEGSEAIVTTADLEGILKGAYNRMTNFEYYGRDYIVTNEVRTPNTWANGRSGRFTTEATFAYNSNGQYIWDNAYAVIASANIIINTDIASLKDFSANGDYAKHLQGQAYAIRALAHFDLVKVYGQQYVDGGSGLGVPYLLEFKAGDGIPSRGTIVDNKTQLFIDVKNAFEFMSDDFFDDSKVFISKYTSKALESRMAVWFEMWEVARDASLAVINSKLYSIITEDQYVSSFATGSAKNSIFELAFDSTDNEGINGLEFIYRGASYGDISVTPNAYNLLYSANDVRKNILGTEQVGSNLRLRNLRKYPERSSNVTLFRYEEVILNMAEAQMKLNEPLMALAYLNMIPENRNAETYTVATIDNILKERRKEFLFEGLYFWDLQRLKLDIIKVDPEQNIQQTIPYGDFRRIHPIPRAELDANSNIVQNPGY